MPATVLFIIIKPLYMINFLHAFKRLLLLVMLLFTAYLTYAQKISITGKVTDEKGAGLANASVLVQGTSNGVTTNSEGAFSIAVPGKDAVLLVSYVGLRTQEITVGNNTTINVQLSA